MRTAFLVSHLFLERDKSSIWRKELSEIAEATGSSMLHFDGPMQALQLLQGKAGIWSLPANRSSGHKPVRRVSPRPSSFVKITLQHARCVRFLHNRAHDAAHGHEVTFAADVLCGWCEDRANFDGDVAASKLYVSGPPGVLQLRFHAGASNSRPGLREPSFGA